MCPTGPTLPCSCTPHPFLTHTHTRSLPHPFAHHTQYLEAVPLSHTKSTASMDTRTLNTTPGGRDSLTEATRGGRDSLTEGRAGRDSITPSLFASNVSGASVPGGRESSGEQQRTGDNIAGQAVSAEGPTLPPTATTLVLEGSGGQQGAPLHMPNDLTSPARTADPQVGVHTHADVVPMSIRGEDVGRAAEHASHADSLLPPATTAITVPTAGPVQRPSPPPPQPPQQQPEEEHEVWHEVTVSVGLCVWACGHVCVTVYVCVCARARAKYSVFSTHRMALLTRTQHTHTHIHTHTQVVPFIDPETKQQVCRCVCVCVCARDCVCILMCAHVCVHVPGAATCGEA